MRPGEDHDRVRDARAQWATGHGAGDRKAETRDGGERYRAFANQDTVGGKTDYWYLVNLPNKQSGWLFGGLLLDYNADQREQVLRQIIDARLKAENTDFADRLEIEDLAARATTEAKDVNTHDALPQKSENHLGSGHL